MAAVPKQDRFGTGVLIAAVLLLVLGILIGWIPLVGWILAPLIAGYFGGKRVSSAGKGFLVGVTAAVFWIVVLLFLLAILFAGTGPLGAIFGISIAAVIFLSSIFSIIFCGIGGAIGARPAPAVIVQPQPSKVVMCRSCGMENPHTSSYCSRCGESLLPSPALSDKQIKTMVLGYIRDQEGELDMDECAEELGLTAEQVERAIKMLKEEGKLEEEEE